MIDCSDQLLVVKESIGLFTVGGGLLYLCIN